MKLQLPPWAHFHQDLHLLVVCPRGIMDEAFVKGAAAMVEKVEAATDAPFNRFLDLSKIDAVDVTFDVAFQIALHRRKVASGKTPMKLAYYVTSPATKRIARTHIMLTEHSPSEVR